MSPDPTSSSFETIARQTQLSSSTTFAMTQSASIQGTFVLQGKSIPLGICIVQQGFDPKVVGGQPGAPSSKWSTEQPALLAEISSFHGF
nr:hypothetical protein CFP56_62100 [Quercus suber]